MNPEAHLCGFVVVASVVEIVTAAVARLASLGSLGVGAGSYGQPALVPDPLEDPKIEVRPPYKGIFSTRTDILLQFRHHALVGSN